MIDLFKLCLGATYTHTAESGDYTLCINGDALYLLFQHSDGKEDWKNNFDFPAKPYRDMKPKWYCHRGFLRVWKAIRDELEPKVADALKNSPQIVKIVCVGYSHGAALAVLATEDMAFLYGDRYRVSGYGFGAPRVLWGAVPKEVKKRLECFTTVRCVPDLVTHVPPVLFGFRNAGRLLRVGEDSFYGPIDAHRAESYLQELCGIPAED